MFRYVMAAVMVGVFVGASAARTEATPIVDQFCCAGSSNLGATFDPVLTRAQTFTVGISGMLTEVDVLLSFGAAAGSSQFDLVPAFGSGATLGTIGAPLGSFTLNWPAASAAGLYALNFALPVTAGQTLAIVQRPNNAGGSWNGYNPGPYAGGEALTTTTANSSVFTNNIFGSSDFGFRTWVDANPTAVPEPATLTLIATGLIGAGARRWRRRQR